jgi:outer membrane protein, heavy metal efflux system
LARREIANRTRLRFIEVLADQRRVALAREYVALAARARDEVAATVRSGRNPETDLHAAELALADAELELEHAEHELASARITLANSWGAHEAGFGEAAGDLDTVPDAEPWDALVARLPSTPASLDAKLAGEVAAARRGLARANSRPDLNTSLGVRRLEGLGEQALVMSVAMPLGNTRRGGLEQREAEAYETARHHDQAAVRAEQHRALFEQYQEMVHARGEFLLLRDRMLPAAEKSLALARRGFDAGRFPFLTLARSQEKLMELRRRRIDAVARQLSLLASIELLAGPPAGDLP